MPLRHTAADHSCLCYGWSWDIQDEDVLAEYVAHIALAQDDHISKIIDDFRESKPTSAPSLKKSAIKKLTLKNKEDFPRRDGWIFQTISWIAAKQKFPRAITKFPHTGLAETGFDGMQIELSTDKTKIASVVIFEDKATVNPRDMIRKSVWSWIESIERRDRDDQIAAGISAMIRSHAGQYQNFNILEAINDALCEANPFRYRVSVMFEKSITSSDDRARLFKGYDKKAPGNINRRQANTMHCPALRKWMDHFASLVIQKIQEL